MLPFLMTIGSPCAVMPTWTLVLQMDPSYIAADPHFIRVTGFITNRDVPLVPNNLLTGSMDQ